MKRLTFALLLLVGATSAGCASAAAKAPPDRPTLDVPAPPAKVVEVSPRPEPTPEPVPELPPAQPPNSRPPKPTNREPTRPDPKPETPTAETPTPPPVSPAPQLRPGTTPADPSEAAKQAQNSIDRASTALKSVNPHGFPKARRAIFDNAQLMLASAVDAFKKSDFDNAKKLAEKVELTAKELGAR